MGRKKGGKNNTQEEQEQLDPNQLKLALFPVGRPRLSLREKKERREKKPKGFAPVQGLRLKSYENVLCSEGTVISGISDQYGRIMEPYVNDKNQWDIMPTGKTIAARH